MKFRKPRIELRTSPHVHSADDVITIMHNVVYALLPLVAWSFWKFGLSSLLLVLTTTATCVLSERLFQSMGGQSGTLRDWSAVITGILLALTLPPGFPLWMAAVAGFFGMALGKAVFGGLGMNMFNPALVGRAFVQAAFPVAITTWAPSFFSDRFTTVIPSTLALPFMKPPATDQWSQSVAIDAFSGATPLGLHKFEGVDTQGIDLLVGLTSSSAGEAAMLIMACGAYLAWRRMLDWRIPMWVMAGAIFTTLPFWLIDPANYPDPLFMVLSGGLMLGAWFMATDMVGSPVTPMGVMIYGLMIGSLTVVIRLFGGLSEGVMYAILLANAATPLIEQVTQPRPFGRARRAKS